MLFDLRARGRRRTVQAVYLFLALLFAIGFIGFGVGGGFGGGGLLEGIFGGKEGGSAGFEGQVKTAEARVHKHPGEAEAWAKLVDAKFHAAGQSENFNQNTQKFTAKGKELLAGIVSDWNRYMALSPSKPNLTAAQDMLTVFSKEALNQPSSGVKVLQEVVIPAKPANAGLYGLLAEFAYQAKNQQIGDLASKKALDLTPAAKRPEVKLYLERIKANPNGNPSAAGEASSQTYTTTTNGKTYKVKLGPKGTATGTAIPTPAPKKK